MNPTRVARFWKTDLEVSLRDGEQLLLTLGLPVVFLAFFSLVDVLPTGDGEPVDFLTPGVLALAVLSVAFVRQAIGVGFDRGFGAIRRFAVTPLRPAEFLAAKLGTTASLAVVQTVVLSVVGLALGWRPDVSPLVVVTVVLGLATFSSLAFVLASRFEGLSSLAVANALYFVLLLVSGLVFELDALPNAMATVVKAVPSTALAALLRDQLSVAGAGPGWAWLCLSIWGVVGAATAVVTFRWD